MTEFVVPYRRFQRDFADVVEAADADEAGDMVLALKDDGEGEFVLFRGDIVTKDVADARLALLEQESDDDGA